MKLLLVRHAESNGNAAGGDYSVENAGSLSPTGVTQAEALASSLKQWDFDSIIASPADRALHTITPYLVATGKKAEVWPELSEACWHDEREPVANAWGLQPAALPDDLAEHFYFRDGQAIRPGPPHTFGAGLRRVYDALTRIEETFGQTDQTVLMASHRFFILEMINLMLNRPDTETVHHVNCGMTMMAYDREWSMEFCNRSPKGVRRTLVEETG